MPASRPSASSQAGNLPERAESLHVASTNAGKLRELTAWLAPHAITVVPAPAGFAVDEDGATFAANALKKAQALLTRVHAPTLADDSGLAVAHLQEAPGVHSARYSGISGAGRDAANCAHLLDALADVPLAARGARMVCVLAYCRPDAPPALFTGTMDGHIALAPAGDGGFGYDPLFVPAGATQTLASLPATFKQAHSHRAAALRALMAHLRQARSAQ